MVIYSLMVIVDLVPSTPRELCKAYVTYITLFNPHNNPTKGGHDYSCNVLKVTLVGKQFSQSPRGWQGALKEFQSLSPPPLDPLLVLLDVSISVRTQSYLLFLSNHPTGIPLFIRW